MDRTLEISAPTATPTTAAVIQRTGNLDYDLCRSPEIVARVRSDRAYAQNLYAALCNRKWQENDLFEILRDRVWSCTWRTAGAIVADIRGEGDYLDWYCSGLCSSHPDDDLGTGQPIEIGYVAEGTVTSEILDDLYSIGWRLIDIDDDLL